MKRYLFLLAVLFVTPLAFGQSDIRSESICVVISGAEYVGEYNIMTMETDFMNYLRDQYKVRIGKSSDLFKVRTDELRFQQTGSVDPSQIKEFGKFMGVDLLCVVSAVKNSGTSNNYSFRAVVFKVENGELSKISKYPDIFESIEDAYVTEINERELQRVDGYLLLRLDVLNQDNRTKLDKALTELDNKKEQQKAKQNENKRKDKREVNATALVCSLIPGVGLMMKGHKAEGAVYMVGDIALIGGGLAFMANANKQKDIMNNHSTGIDQYKSAEKKYNSSKTAAYCCFGTAAGLYIVNLVRSYVAKPKPDARLEWAFVPSVAPSMYGEPNMSMNLALSYKF